MSKISVLFIRSGAGPSKWVAQGLEYDIAAQGKTIKEAMRSFEVALISELAYAKDKGKEFLDDLESAPQRYWDLWEQAGVPAEIPESPFRIPEFLHAPRLREARVA